MDDFMPDIDSMIDSLHQYAERGDFIAAESLALKVNHLIPQTSREEASTPTL